MVHACYSAYDCFKKRNTSMRTLNRNQFWLAPASTYSIYSPSNIIFSRKLIGRKKEMRIYHVYCLSLPRPREDKVTFFFCVLKANCIAIAAKTYYFWAFSIMFLFSKFLSLEFRYSCNDIKRLF